MNALKSNLVRLTEGWSRLWPSVRKVLFWHPLGKPFAGGKGGRPKLWYRVALAIGYRLAILPIFFAITWVAVLLWMTHPSRHEVTVLPEQFSLAYENVEFTSADGVTLSGWYLSSLSAADVLQGSNWRKLRPAVVICHDYGAARDQFLYPLGTQLVAAGYEVLLFDFRGHGASGDAPVSFGVTEAADVIAAVEFLQHKPGVDPNRIGVFGTGMGAYAAMLAAPRCKGIQCVVAESAYPSVDKMFRRGAQLAHLPEAAGSSLTWGLSLYFGHRLMDNTAVDAAEDFGNTGILLVSGADDRRSPQEDVRSIRTATHHRAWNMVVNRSGHGQTLYDPATAVLVVQYINTYLTRPSTANETAAR